MKYGKIVESSTLMLRISCGEATDENGVKYELTTSPSGNSIVRSGKTGRFFVLSWRDVVKMAQNAGINESGGA